MVNKDDLPPNVTLRPHVYDGIQEYDQRLPNWWLFTFYGAIAFSVFYWMSWYQARIFEDDATVLSRQMNQIQATAMMASGELSDTTLQAMSSNADIVATGKEVYDSYCVTCHLPSMLGKDEGGIGFNLIDAEWVHGSSPLDIAKTVKYGVPEKGMAAWLNIIGPQKVAEVTAYILSKQDPSVYSPDSGENTPKPPPPPQGDDTTSLPEKTPSTEGVFSFSAPPSDVEIRALMADAEAVKSGQAIYASHCQVCHGSQLQGQPEGEFGTTKGGPLHAFDDNPGQGEMIFSAVRYGAPDSGMAPYGDAIGATGAAHVSAYILYFNQSLRD